MTIRNILDNSGIKYTWKDASRIGQLAKITADESNIIPKKIKEGEFYVYYYPKLFIPIIQFIIVKHFTKNG